MASIVAYHGVTASDHQARFDELAPQGFRPLSLNVSGDPGDARYAAVWIQRPGVEWVAMHGVDAATYQARFDELVAHGLSPSIVSATGPAGSASFTALFERVPRRWFARHNLRWGPDTDPDTITHENGRAADEGYLPLCLSVYGDPDDLRYAGIWVGNERTTPWSWWSISGDAYQRFFDALVRAGTRPAWVAPAPNGSYLATYRDETIGEWAARHGLDGNQYQAEFDQEVAAGLWPLVVQASGAGGGTRYASLFVRDDTPLAKRWTVTGAGFPGDADLDETVRGIMQASSIRAGSVAVARNGTLRRQPRLHVGRGRLRRHAAEHALPAGQRQQAVRVRRPRGADRRRDAQPDHGRVPLPRHHECDPAQPDARPAHQHHHRAPAGHADERAPTGLRDRPADDGGQRSAGRRRRRATTRSATSTASRSTTHPGPVRSSTRTAPSSR